MIEYMLSFTSLPNLHPAVVHFPIALAIVGLLVDGLSLILRKREYLGFSATLLYALAALGSIATYLSGRQAANVAGSISVNAEALLSEHADLALLTVLALCFSALLRLAGAILNRKLGSLLSVAAIVLMIGANGLLAVTADHGGALVYRHGVSVTLREPSAKPDVAAPLPRPEPGPRDLHLTQGDDGTVSWRPHSDDGQNLGAVLQPAEGASLDVLKPVETTKSDEAGLWVKVSGATVVCLPGTFSDVVVTATVDLTAFEGVFGLGHHIQAVGEGVFFTVNSGGEAELFRRAGGTKTSMDQGALTSDPGLVTLRTSVAGKHLKGQLGEETVVHGHGKSEYEEGAVGLLLDGRGRVLITEISVEPVQ